MIELAVFKSLNEFAPKVFDGISIMFIFNVEGLLEFEVFGGVDKILFLGLVLVFYIVDCDETVGKYVLVRVFWLFWLVKIGILLKDIAFKSLGELIRLLRIFWEIVKANKVNRKR